jgi:SAM-dependent methyltransferase
MPGVPADYHARIRDIEGRHWWHAGMQRIATALLGDRLLAPSQRLLDAGCGSGGFLRWALEHWPVASASGVDISEAAIDLAVEQVPAAELSVAPMRALPFESETFDLVATHDVLQHLESVEIDESVAELARVLRPGGALFVRTNGGRRARAQRSDWRVYDAGSLSALLDRAGLRLERITHANMLPSFWAAARGRAPRAPTETSHGVPTVPGRSAQVVCGCLLAAEARYLRRPGRSLPYGHTLLAVCGRG